MMPTTSTGNHRTNIRPVGNEDATPRACTVETESCTNALPTRSVRERLAWEARARACRLLTSPVSWPAGAQRLMLSPYSRPSLALS